MFDTWWALLWSSASVATRVHGSVGHRPEVGEGIVRPFGARRDGKAKSSFLKSEALLLVLSLGIPTQNFSRP
jgi:hypothetical protein